MYPANYRLSQNAPAGHARGWLRADRATKLRPWSVGAGGNALLWGSTRSSAALPRRSYRIECLPQPTVPTVFYRVRRHRRSSKENSLASEIAISMCSNTRLNTSIRRFTALAQFGWPIDASIRAIILSARRMNSDSSWYRCSLLLVICLYPDRPLLFPAKRGQRSRSLPMQCRMRSRDLSDASSKQSL